MPLTQKTLKNLIFYNPDSGLFTWKQSLSSKAKAGTIAGTMVGKYQIIQIDKIRYKSHRLAWLYIYGEFPSKSLDHINEIKTDNRIQNLREVTTAQNMQNVTKNKFSYHSKYMGVTWHKRSKKWYARIKINYIEKYLGLFDNEIDAATAYLNAKRELHPFWVEK
jgi:hypothetical protein